MEWGGGGGGGGGMCKLQWVEICTLLKKIMVGLIFGVKINENLNLAQKNVQPWFF